MPSRDSSTRIGVVVPTSTVKGTSTRYAVHSMYESTTTGRIRKLHLTFSSCLTVEKPCKVGSKFYQIENHKSAQCNDDGDELTLPIPVTQPQRYASFPHYIRAKSVGHMVVDGLSLQRSYDSNPVSKL